MRLNVSIQKCDEGTVWVDLVGPLVIGANAEVLSNTLDVLLGKYSEVVIDMTYVSRIDARGIGCLVSAYARGCAAGTRVSLYNLHGFIKDVLVIVKLTTVLDGSAFERLPRAA